LNNIKSKVKYVISTYVPILIRIQSCKFSLFNMVHTTLVPAKISIKYYDIWMQTDIILVQKNV